jgi:hypothetical protein
MLEKIKLDAELNFELINKIKILEILNLFTI